MQLHIRDRLAELHNEWRDAKGRHPRLVIGIAAAFALAIVLFVAGLVSFTAGLRQGLPDKDAIARMGVMDQGTGVYDDNDQLAFTIFKEQRIEVPLSSISPYLIRALIAIEDQRFYDHSGFDAFIGRFRIIILAPSMRAPCHIFWIPTE